MCIKLLCQIIYANFITILRSHPGIFMLLGFYLTTFKAKVLRASTAISTLLQCVPEFQLTIASHFVEIALNKLTLPGNIATRLIVRSYSFKGE